MNLTTPNTEAVMGPHERIDLLEKKALISALWIFNLLNHLFRGLHEIVKAEFLTEALAGVVGGVEVTEALFLLGGIMIEVPIMMVVLTWVLPLRSNRWANLIVAPLFGLTLLNQPGDLDDYFHVGIELMALAIIVWQVWRWGRSPVQAEATA